MIKEDIRQNILTIDELAENYFKQGNYNKAVYLQLVSLQKREEDLPENQQDIAANLYNISVTYDRLGQEENSLNYAIQALEIRKNLLTSGDNHISSHIANNLSLIAILHMKQGKHIEAIEYFKQSLEIYQSLNDERALKISQAIDNILCTSQDNTSKENHIDEQSNEENNTYKILADFNIIC